MAKIQLDSLLGELIAHNHDDRDLMGFFNDAASPSDIMPSASSGSSAYGARRDHAHRFGNGTVAASSLVDGAILTEILDDDGHSSGLDADLLDGNHASAFPSFQDSEGLPANVATSASYGVSTRATRRDHVHALADSVVTTAKIAPWNFVQSGSWSVGGTISTTSTAWVTAGSLGFSTGSGLLGVSVFIGSTIFAGAPNNGFFRLNLDDSQYRILGAKRIPENYARMGPMWGIFLFDSVTAGSHKVSLEWKVSASEVTLACYMFGDTCAFYITAWEYKR